MATRGRPTQHRASAPGPLRRRAAECCLPAVARVEVEDTRQLRLDITRQIRQWRPDLVITQNPSRSYHNFHGWHRDHRITGGVVLDCVYPLARDYLAFPELWPEYEPHTVHEVYLIQWEQPRLVVDITDTIGLKLKAG